MFVLRGRPPGQAGGLKGSKTAHSESVMRLGEHPAGRLYIARCSSVHMPNHLSIAPESVNHSTSPCARNFWVKLLAVSYRNRPQSRLNASTRDHWTALQISSAAHLSCQLSPVTGKS